MRIVLFLRNLQTGGAERQFLQIAGGLADRGHDVHLITRTADGDLSGLLDPRVERHVLFRTPRGRLGRGLELVRSPHRLRRQVVELAPDVVYSALFLNNALAHRALQGLDIPLVWGFRNAAQPLSKLRARAWRYNKRHAGDVRLAISNCQAGATYLAHEGLPLRQVEVIPNGVDATRFRPLPEQRQPTRQAWGVPDEAFLVGCVGRLHPMKDHPTFLRAARAFRNEVPQARFVCLGSGDADHARRLRALASELGLDDAVLWTEVRGEVPAALAALDLVASTSLAEGFPNALTEALACEVPVVATDVGDTALLLERPERLTATSDPMAQCQAWLALYRTPAQDRAAAARADRERVVHTQSIERCVERTEEVLRRVVAT